MFASNFSPLRDRKQRMSFCFHLNNVFYKLFLIVSFLQRIKILSQQQEYVYIIKYINISKLCLQHILCYYIGGVRFYQIVSFFFYA